MPVLFAWLTKLLLAGARWIAPIFIQELISFVKNGIVKYFAERKKQREEAKQNKAAAEEYKKKVADPNLTREERKNAEDDYLNS